MSEESVEKHRILIEELADKTRFEKIEWENGHYNGGIRASVGKYFIDIYETSSEFEESDYHVSISDTWGSEVDHFTDNDLAKTGSRPRDGESYYALISQMFKSAHRQIKGADKALDSIIGHLKEILPF